MESISILTKLIGATNPQKLNLALVGVAARIFVSGDHAFENLLRRHVCHINRFGVTFPPSTWRPRHRLSFPASPVDTSVVAVASSPEEGPPEDDFPDSPELHPRQNAKTPKTAN